MYDLILFYFIICLYYLNKVISIKIISLQPGGLNGFYMFGISKFIKQNYPLENTKYFGSSAGAWNSLYLCKKTGTSTHSFQSYLEDLDISNFKNLYDIEDSIKQFYLNNHKSSDFNLHQLNICVGHFKKTRLEKKIYTGFYDLEDTINCCMASSHIPLITNNNLFFKYKNKLSIDGGFFSYPHPENVNPNIIIYPQMWENSNLKHNQDLKKFNISQNILWGYQDAFLHKSQLDNALL